MYKKWNSGEILKFLEHVQKYPVVWDTCHAEYRNRNQKDEAYSDLLEDLLNEGFPENITTNYLKDKLKNIRDTYAVEVKKVLASAEDGKEYRPRLLWFDKADAFLRPSFTRKKCISKISRYGKPRRCQATDNHSDENELSESSLPESREFPCVVRTKSIENITTPVEKLSEYSAVEFDEYDYFGKIVAITLKKLSQEDAWKAEDEIRQVLRKYKRKKHQIYSDFIEVSPDHLLSDPSSFTVNNLASTVCSTPNLESTSEVSSMCLENENSQPSKRPCIKIIRTKPVSDSVKSEPNQQVQQVYLV